MCFATRCGTAIGLCGTEMVRSLGHEVTGEWLDEGIRR